VLREERVKAVLIERVLGVGVFGLGECVGWGGWADCVGCE